MKKFFNGLLKNPFRVIGIIVVPVVLFVLYRFVKQILPKVVKEKPGLTGNVNDNNVDFGNYQVTDSQGQTSALKYDKQHYASMADSVQQYLQGHSFVCYIPFDSSTPVWDMFKTYGYEKGDWLALHEAWGLREFTGSFMQNPFGGFGDQAGTFATAIRQRCCSWEVDQFENEVFKPYGL